MADFEKKDSSNSDIGKKTEIEHAQKEATVPPLSENDRKRLELNKLLADPLAHFTREELAVKGEEYARKYDLGDEEDVRAFRFGAMLAKDVEHPELVKGMSEEDVTILEKEKASKWSQPKLLYLIVVLCSTCAAVQGMGELFVFA